MIFFYHELKRMRRSIPLVSLCISIILLFLTLQAQAATTSVHIVKYASDETTILNETNVTCQWMEDNLPVHGDGETHYFHQGPVFESEWNETHPGEPYDSWNLQEDVNVESRDFGAVKGTDIKDLCDLVGGMSPDDEIMIHASDGFRKYFDYTNVYEPQARRGPLVLTWWRAEEGYVPEYFSGMRLIFFADDYVFGNWNMHECLAPKYWHNFSAVYPSTGGLSVKYVDEIAVYSMMEPSPSPSSPDDEDEEPPLSPAPSPSPSPVPSPSPILLRGPYITGTTTSTTIINWKTDIAVDGTVKYATEEYHTESGEYDQTITDTEKKELHHLVITNLTPNTIHHYQLTVGNESYGDYTFRTYPCTNESFTFIVYGDTREQIPLFTQMERHKLVADRIAEEENVSFVIHTGDLVCDGSNPTQWDVFFDAGRAMLANTTVYPVLGNHEDNHTNYYDAFGVPEWYSFDCGNAHFTVLDSNDWAMSYMTEQTAWLRNDIDSDATWKFVIFHHPPYSSDERHWGGWTSFRDYWEDIFINNSVNAVFNGHVHVYERYEVKGIHYVVLGCGGAPLYSLAEGKIPGYQNSFEHTLGYARITIDGDNATIDVVKVADVSGDNKEVTHIYPSHTIFERVVLNQTSIPAPAPTPTPIPTSSLSPTPTPSSSPSSSPFSSPIPSPSTTQKTSGFGVLFAIIGLLAIAYLIKRRK